MGTPTTKSFREQAIGAAERIEEKRMASLQEEIRYQMQTHRKEVYEVISHFNNISGMELQNHIQEIIDIVSAPKARGFHFKCFNPAFFLSKMRELTGPQVNTNPNYYGPLRKNAVFKEDKRTNPIGHFSALNTHGIGFREIGPGNAPSMHIAVGETDSICDIHIDSHGYTLSADNYGGIFLYGLYHLKYDLLPEVPFFQNFYGPLGENGYLTFQPRIGNDMDERLRIRDRLIFFYYNLEGKW